MGFKLLALGWLLGLDLAASCWILLDLPLWAAFCVWSLTGTAALFLSALAVHARTPSFSWMPSPAPVRVRA